MIPMRAGFCVVALLIASEILIPLPATQENFEQVAQQAEAARSAGRIPEALRFYDAGTRLRPSWSNGWWWLGRLYYDQNRFPDAEIAFNRFLAIAPSPGPGYAFLALCEYETRHCERSIEHFRDWTLEGSPGPEQLIHAANLHWALLLTREERFAEALCLLTAEAHERGGGPTLTEGMGLASLRMAYLPEEYPPAKREMIWLAGEAAFYASLNPPQIDRSDERVREFSRHYGRRPNLPHLRGGLCPSTKELAATEKEHQSQLRISPQHVPPVEGGPPRPETRPSGPQGASFEQLSHAAQHALNEDRGDEAIRLYQQALMLEPDWPQGLWDLSTVLYARSRYAEARDVLRHFVSLEVNSGPGKALLGMSEFQTREYARALDHLRQSLDLGLANSKGMTHSVLYLAALLLTRFEMYDQSLRILFDMVRSGVPQGPLVEAAGLASLRMPLLPAEIPPDRLEIVRLAGNGSLALWDQRYDDASKLFTRMTAAYPNGPGVHFLFGLFLMNDRPEEAIREMKREIEISPSHVAARVRLAEEYVKTGQCDLGLAVAEEAVKLEPTASSTHMVLGEALVAKGDLPRGIHELETARDQAPEMTRIRWELFRAYSAAGRSENARQEKEAIEKLTQPGATP